MTSIIENLDAIRRACDPTSVDEREIAFLVACDAVAEAAAHLILVSKDRLETRRYIECRAIRIESAVNRYEERTGESYLQIRSCIPR